MKNEKQIEEVREYKYYVCYNTATEDYEGGQNMSVTDAEEANERNLTAGDPHRWIIDKELNESPCGE